MSRTARYTLAALITLAVSPLALGQFHDANPAAAEAFAEMIRTYRERPSLKVTTSVAIEVAQGDMEARSSEVHAEFTFGRDKAAIVKVRDLQCFLSGNTINVVHGENENAYFTMSDEGSPYYALMAIFMNLPYPHLAIMLGEQDMDDLYMQFHPQAPWSRPTSVATERRDDRVVEVITMTSDFEHMDVVIDAETKLIQSIHLEITGGHLVQAGTTMTYEHEFTYETFDEPLPAETFAFDSGERNRVDMLAQLSPPRERGGRRGVAGGPVVGREAPPLLLATIDGDAIDIEDLRGQVVVIDFWATWCGPCVVALPLLHDLAQWARDEMLPVTVFTVNTFEIPNPSDNTPDARLAQASKFWEEHRFRLPVAMDYTDEVAAAYGVGGIPTTVVIRSDGVVHSKHVGAGPTYVEDLKRDIRAAIDALEQTDE